ncbi:MAG: carbohydrate ABC transporter substrate-binding protein [Chloroflexi bacterium]|nr:carbohydrate ABC transporter substrate-binding protein [Chloroflexota bacterium]
MFHTRKWTLFATLLTLVAVILAACGAPADTGNTTASASPAASASAAASAAPESPAASASVAASASPEASMSPEASASAAASGAATAGGKLEIFSWWTNGGEADGLNAMFDIYKQQHAGVEIVNATVAGGAGTNAKAVLQTRLAGGQPPDTWQLHAGRETLSYVQAGQLEPLTAFFKEQGFDQVMPKLLLDQITIEGEIYTVPVNVHRSNMMWYNPKVFQDNNLQPPKTLDEFFTVAEALKAKGITPLAVGGKDGFEASHLFESVLLATFGPQDYTNLWTGDATAWADERVVTAIDTMARMLSYANEDRSARSWSEAAQLVLEGKAGMTIMGDWAEGYFLTQNAKPNVDFGYAPSPGTDGNFMWLSDSFGLAKGAPDRDNGLAWLAVAGSKEGQDAFNPKKGSIPARTDADKSLYDEYLQSSIAAFASNTLAPSAAHGAATTNAYQQAFHESLEVFSSDPTDTEGVLAALTEAVADLTR